MEMFFLKNQKKRIKSPRYTNGLLDGAALPKPRCHAGGAKRSESRERGDSSAGSSSGGDSVPRPLSAPAGLNLMVPQDTPFEEQYARIICHHQDYFHRLQSRREKANKVATIRQHYYPEGEWGWAVSGCAFVVHLLTNGIVLAFAHLLGQVHQKWNHVPQINIGSRLMTTTPPKAYAMNKFNLRPSLELRFKPDEAKQLMKEIVNPLLDSIEKYDATIISQLTRRISEEVVRRLKELSDHANEEEEAVRPSTAASIRSLGDGTTGGRYKIICHTVIVENRGAGIRVSYGQQWDIDSDGAVSHFYASSCLQCICTVLAIFYY